MVIQKIGLNHLAFVDEVTDPTSRQVLFGCLKYKLEEWAKEHSYLLVTTPQIIVVKPDILDFTPDEFLTIRCMARGAKVTNVNP
jgi:hypothetical protein